jgi:hypothetical protein
VTWLAAAASTYIRSHETHLRKHASQLALSAQAMQATAEQPLVSVVLDAGNYANPADMAGDRRQSARAGFIPPDMRQWILDKFGKMLTTDRVVDEIVAILNDSKRTGVARVLLQNGHAFDWQPQLPAAAANVLVRQSSNLSMSRRREAAQPPTSMSLAAAPAVPSHFQQWVVKRLSRNFTEAVELVEAPMPSDIPAGHVLVQRHVTGVNASDVNFTSGAYHGSMAAAEAALPFVAGFESVGIVALAAPDSGVLWMQRAQAVCPGWQLVVHCTCGDSMPQDLSRDAFRSS